MHVAVLLALLQHPAAPAAFPVTKVEITPPAAEIEIGQTVRLAARALDARGQPVTGATIAWYSGDTEGDVDSTGLVKGGYNGYVRVTAVAFIPGQQGQVFGDAVIHVLPEPAARIDVTRARARARDPYGEGGSRDAAAPRAGRRRRYHPARGRACVERRPNGGRHPVHRERERRPGPRDGGCPRRVGRGGERR